MKTPVAITVLIVIAGAVPPASAASKTWDGQGALERWDSGINWVGNNAPNANDDPVWPENGTLGYETDNDFPTGTQFRSLTITSVDHGAVNGWRHNGNRIHLTHGITFVGDDTRLGMPIRLTSDQPWNGGAGALLRLLNGSTLDINGRTLNLNGHLLLDDARLIGAGMLNVPPAGSLTLRQPAYSFTGTINCDSLLRVTDEATLTGSAFLNLNPGAVLELIPPPGVPLAHTVRITAASGPGPGEEVEINCILPQFATETLTLPSPLTPALSR